MKKILCLALILALFATAAYAEQDTILTVSALRNVHQTEFIRELCFGDEYRDVVITSNLGEVEGYREGRQGKAPYFIAGPDRSRKPVLQSHYYIRRSDDKYILTYKGKGLTTVAVISCITALAVEGVLFLIK